MPTIKPVQQTAAQLRQVSVELETHVAHLRMIADGMDVSEIYELSVTNYDQLRRAMEYLDNYAHAARRAMRELKEGRGDFGTKGSPTKNGKANK